MKNHLVKFSLFVKRLLSRQSGPLTEKYVEWWKNYYEILRVSPNAEPQAINAAYKRLERFFRNALSDTTRKSTVFSEMRNDINEAYQVLSNPIRRTAYDRMFFAKYFPQDTEADESTKKEIFDLMQLVAQDVLQKRRRIHWRIPRVSEPIRRAVVVIVASLLAILIGGTSLAFAKPEHAMVAPFQGIAIAVTEASAEAIGLIEDSRGIVAIYERRIMSTCIQSLRVEEGLEEISPVTVSTNDMACFPSQEHCLFPDYLDRRFSQFKYTVDSKGIVSVDASGATTDALLEKIRQLLYRLKKRE